MDKQLRSKILELLEQRAPGKTICPSEAPRATYSHDWREHMESCRQEATLLAHEGEIEICQNGRAVDPDNFTGAIRLRLRE
jgi:hypothetical protein